MGDSIVLTPALKALKQKYPYVKISILLFHRRKYLKCISKPHPFIELSKFEGTAEIFKNNPFTDEVLELDRKAIRELKGLKRLKAELYCIKFLRSQKFDAVISTFPQNRFVLWSFFAGIKIRIGEKGQQFEGLLTHKPQINRSDFGVLNYFCNLLLPLGITVKDKNTIFNLTEEARVIAKEILFSEDIKSGKKLLIIHPGASDKDRQWSPEKMAELFKLLNSQNNIQLMTVFSEYDKDYINILEHLLEKKIRKIKTEKISELAGLFSFADAVLVHNSGPRHLAASLGIKTIALLEKYDDIIWKVYENENLHRIILSEKICKFCNANKCRGIIPPGNIYGASCINDISAEVVYNSITSFLADTNI